jgi:hypothetical protein
MLQYVVGIMFAAGCLGGLINFFLADPAAEKPLPWWQHIIVGLGAAFMVPVFLNMISSRLIAEITGTEVTAEILSKLLVLAGFCLLAAVSSRAFIRTMTDKLLQEVSAAKKEAKEAKKQAESAEAIASLSVEPEATEATVAPATRAVEEAPNGKEQPEVSETEKKILQAMLESRFAMRSMSGVAKDSGLSVMEVKQALNQMIERGLIAEAKNKDGQLRWYPTFEGRNAANEA